MRKNLEGTLKPENNKENSTSICELHGVREVQFGTLVLALYHYFDDKK